MRKRDRLFGGRLGKSGDQPASNSIPLRPGPQAASRAPSTNSAASTVQEKATGSTTAPNAALQLAIQNHVDSLPEADKEAFRQGCTQITATNLLSRIKAYDEEHKSNSHLRSHSEAVSRFLSVLDRFMAGITIAIQANPDPSSLAVGAIRVVLDLALNFVSFFAKFSQMLCRLGDFLEPLAKYSEAAGEQSLILTSLAAVYGDLLQFCRKARGVFVDSAGAVRRWTSWRLFWRVQWMPFEDEFGSIEADMKHHLAVLDHSAQGIVLNATLAATRSERERRERERADERESFLNWISSIPFETVHEKIFSKRHPGTGEWLLQTAKFQEWFHSIDSALLWCHGKPGAGKSVLASNVLEYVTTERALESDVGICFAYYDYQNEKQLGDVSKIITALIKQLCRKNDNLPAGFLKTKKDSLDPSQLGHLDAFGEIALEFKKEVFIIIDALDECPREERPQILRFLTQAIQSLPHAKIFVTSRRSGDIEEAFNEAQTPIIEIEAQNIASDISLYVSNETKQLRNGHHGMKLHLRDSSLEQLIIETLSNKAEGMFLWANLQLSTLCRVSECRKDSEVKKALHNLPSDLDSTYTRILEQIINQDEYMRTLAFKTFRWILFTERPLTCEELLCAIAYDELQDDLQEPELDDIKVILNACANLLSVDDSQPENYPMVRPIHFSVPEFLKKTSSEIWSQSRLTYISDYRFAHAKLAQACMTYLHMHLAALSPCSGDFELYYLLRGNKFLWYAARSFDFHLVHCQPISEKLVQQTINLLSLRPASLAVLLQCKSVQSRSGMRQAPHPFEIEMKFSELKIDAGALIYSSRLFEIEDLKEHTHDLDQPHFALHYACNAGHFDLISTLLTNGANVNESDIDNLQPIYFSAARGDLETVKLLIYYGANVNNSCGIFGNPLQVASSKGYIDIVELLLKNGANVNAQGGHHGNALLAASSLERVNIIELLLKNGADVNAQGGFWGNALQAASLGSLDIVKLLLKNGAEVNARGGRWGNALQAASFTQNFDIVELLLKSGADVNAQGGTLRNALQAASYRGTFSIVELLLKNGADVNAQGGPYGNALQAASREGCLDMVEPLLENGADINAQGGPYGNALQAAPHEGCLDIVELLLKSGADINAQGGRYGNALQAASRGGCLDIVGLLLKCGADINAHGGKCGNALQAASYGGYLDIVALLLKKGADVNAQGGRYGNALQAASIRKGGLNIVALLLENGANVNAQGGRYGNALQAAIENGTDAVIELLRNHGAIDDVQNDRAGEEFILTSESYTESEFDDG